MEQSVEQAVAMIIGLLVLVVVQGVTTFWPVPVVRLQTAQGTTFLGEVTRSELYKPSRATIEGLPSSASMDYGAPVGEHFARYEGDFYKIDPLLFSPAEVALSNARSGRTFRAGGVNAGVLAGSLLG